MYARFGWNAPFLFCLALCGFDLLARLFVIEQRDLPKYGLPMAIYEVDSEDEEEAPVGDVRELEDAEEELSLIGVVKALATNRRGMTGFMGTAVSHPNPPIDCDLVVVLDSPVVSSTV